MFIKNFDTDTLKYKYIGISAFIINQFRPIDEILIKIKDLTNNYGTELQLFDAGCIATWEHLFFAAINALQSTATGHNLANNLTIELSLYVSGNRQIKIALEKFGVKPNTKTVAVCIFGNQEKNIMKCNNELLVFFDAAEAIAMLEINDEKFHILKQIFAIQDIEIDSLASNAIKEEKYAILTNIIIDRGAMVALEK